MRALLLIGLVSLALTACSSDEGAATGKTPGDNATTDVGAAANVIKVSVPSMQCESCAKTIRTALKGVEGAEDVDVNVDEKTVFVHVVDNTPAMKAEIEHAISDAGYKTESLDRNAAAYESLPECCKEGAKH